MQYFKNSEFTKATPSCSIDDMDSDFMDRLDLAREVAGIPFVINSAYRTVEYEHEQGRDGSSSHTKGLAVDLKATGSRQRFKIVKALIEAGFNRIGVGKDFIHVDGDPDKDQEVMWDYYSTSGGDNEDPTPGGGPGSGRF